MKDAMRNYVLKSIGFFAVILICMNGYGDRVQLGLEVLLEEKLDLIQGKNIGIIANHTAVDAQGRHIVDLLLPYAKIVALFGPEHGFKGSQSAGDTIKDEALSGVPIYSLYGEFKTPTPAMLKGVDVLIYDIQDVGVKFYTYISNLFLCMNAAQRESIHIIVLDRPNPIDASRVEGAVTNPMFASFVGVMPLTARYGLTVGEIAMLMNGEIYAGFALQVNLTVVPMKNYKRDMWYDETGLPWVAPSPNMTTLDTAIVYPGLCLIEGTNLSEGRGTDAPFLTIGAPYINAKELLQVIPVEVKKGIELEAVSFTPKEIAGVSNNPKHIDKLCHGFKITVTDRDEFQPIPFAVAVICAAHQLYPKQFEFTESIDRLWGDENLRGMVKSGKSYQEIMNITGNGVQQFRSIRKKYLLYY